MRIHYVTYATHSFGFFEQLKNNKFNIPIKVLGWKTKWINFMDKIKAIKQYTYELNDNDILVFLDGFDTLINKDPKNIEQLFLKFNSQIVVSKDLALYGNYVTRKVFGVCSDNHTANSGMYMGYASAIRNMCEQILEINTIDDQHGLNVVCKKLDIKIDSNNIIFVNSSDKNTKQNSIFVSYPCGAAFGVKNKLSRYYRSMYEYGPYFKGEILLLLLIIVCLIYYKKEIINQISNILRR